MSNQNFDFNNTRDALNQLSRNLIELESSVKVKLGEIASASKESSDIIKQKDEIISGFTKASENALAKIESITGFIDKVL